MKKQYRILNKGKGILNISLNNLQEVGNTSTETVNKVLKSSEIVFTGLDFTLPENAFIWKINNIIYDNAIEYSNTVIPASIGNYKYLILQGDTANNYSLKYGTESDVIGIPPAPDAYKIVLNTFLLYEDIINNISEEGFSSLYLKRYKPTFKTTDRFYHIVKGADDNNVILLNTTLGFVIVPADTPDNYIKNGAIYPLKSMGSAAVFITAETDVIINAPNGVNLSKNQQCYLIKDDYNQWTFINPLTAFSSEAVNGQFLVNRTGRMFFSNDLLPGDIVIGTVENEFLNAATYYGGEFDALSSYEAP